MPITGRKTLCSSESREQPENPLSKCHFLLNKYQLFVQTNKNQSLSRDRAYSTVSIRVYGTKCRLVQIWLGEALASVELYVKKCDKNVCSKVKGWKLVTDSRIFLFALFRWRCFRWIRNSSHTLRLLSAHAFCVWMFFSYLTRASVSKLPQSLRYQLSQ